VADDRQPRVTHYRLEAAARGRFSEHELLPLTFHQALLDEPHARDGVGRRGEPPLRLVEQVIAGADHRHAMLLSKKTVGVVTPIFILDGRLDACQVLFPAHPGARVWGGEIAACAT